VIVGFEEALKLIPSLAEAHTVAFNRALSKTAAAHKLRMVILDANRNNPFRMAPGDGRWRAIGRGRAPAEPPAVCWSLCGPRRHHRRGRRHQRPFRPCSPI
jgi:hypothetical protein